MNYDSEVNEAVRGEGREDEGRAKRSVNVDCG